MTPKTSWFMRLRTLGKKSKSIFTRPQGRPQVGRPTKVDDKPAAPVSFRAVEVKPGRNCCLAATAMVGRRHLMREKPLKLPLLDCNRMDSCDCKFQHHADRRAGPRRRGWAIVETKIGHELLMQQRPPDKIRRTRGRRKSD